MKTSDLDFHLPPERIATQPASPRDHSRLLVFHRDTATITHHRFTDLPDIPGAVRPGDLLVFNETRVLPARFHATRASTGGHITGLYLHAPAADQWEVMLESGGKLQVGEQVTLAADTSLTLLERRGGGLWRARLNSAKATLDVLDAVGHTPLPPYILKQRRADHQAEEQPDDRERYNTVYAREPGSVAAPTAGLHFTDTLLARLEAMGVGRATVTLHVGMGTFAPVRTEQLEAHDMHHESYAVPRATLDAIRDTQQRGGRVIPVGTTTVRTLESLPDNAMSLPLGEHDSYRAATNLFIMPGFAFRYTDSLITNFHLPRSTLLALVAALPDVGVPRLLSIYDEAIEHGYRFYSYGDAMMVV